ncbi:MAG TPA: hypothetical protein VJ846_12810 [Sphingomicrobium sp.]|nr:hypothetical protein [Sphingomicrobium sp.]
MNSLPSPFLDPDTLAPDPVPFKLDKELFMHCISFPVELPEEELRSIRDEFRPFTEACGRK